MTLNKGMKEISIKVRGRYEPDDAKRFAEEFIKLVSTIHPSEFLLWFDAEELKVSTQAMVPVLEGSFKMYALLLSFHFTKVLLPFYSFSFFDSLLYFYSLHHLQTRL